MTSLADCACLTTARALTASWEKTARLWDAATGKEVGKFEGHTDYVLSAVFSPDGKQVLTASDDKTGPCAEC